MNRNDELYHFGIKGMKWGVRRYQNKDGSLTKAGKKRYSYATNKEIDSEFFNAQQKYERTSDKKTDELERLLSECNQLARTHTFDTDDGGGWETEADKKAAIKYMEKQERIADLMDDIRAEGAKSARGYILNKYGIERIKKYDTTKAISQTIGLGMLFVGGTAGYAYNPFMTIPAAIRSGLVASTVTSAVDSIPMRYEKSNNKNR